MKQKRRFEITLPDECVRAIKIYIDSYREILLHTSTKAKHIETNALWISRDGTPLQEGPFYVAVIKRTKQEFGKRVWLHLFRDCKATHCMLVAPQLASDVKDMLGHNSIAVTEQSYSHAPMRAYSARHADHLDDLIKSARLKRKKSKV